MEARRRGKDSNRNEAAERSEETVCTDPAVKSDYYVVAPIDYCGPVGRSIRHFFLALIEVIKWLSFRVQVL